MNKLLQGPRVLLLECNSMLLAMILNPLNGSLRVALQLIGALTLQLDHHLFGPTGLRLIQAHPGNLRIDILRDFLL